jgi:hypothetical protein
MELFDVFLLRSFTVHNTTQRSYGRIIGFFGCFSMGKMVICRLILSKTFHIFHFLYYNNTILHFRQYPYTTHTTIEYYHTTAEKTSHMELISTIGSLHISLFLLHTSPFSTGRTGRIVYLKNLCNTRKCL